MGFVDTTPQKLTLAQFDALPDDGMRHELLDGRLLVTPAPKEEHQRAAGVCYAALLRACPEDMEVFFAPFDFRPNGRTSLQPDLMVFQYQDVGGDEARRTLVLVVEVLSPSNRSTDLIMKRHAYEKAGIASYWIIDPDAFVLTVLELADGEYVERTFKGDEAFAAEHPFPVRIVPAELARRVNRSV
ncbi:Uma2 family endonuclease [Kribbella sp. NPDC000426]|uniref:Uma2 family endonuclease n=1 Tax=Kribbella sp. NPDC000426 TaxID=3154255 RepID=UPI0033299173